MPDATPTTPPATPEMACWPDRALRLGDALRRAQPTPPEPPSVDDVLLQRRLDIFAMLRQGLISPLEAEARLSATFRPAEPERPTAVTVEIAHALALAETLASRHGTLEQVGIIRRARTEALSRLAHQHGQG